MRVSLACVYRRYFRLTGQPYDCLVTQTQIEPEWIVWSHGLVPALTVASRMAGGEGDAVMVRSRRAYIHALHFYLFQSV